MTIQDYANYLESIASISLQENYDNCGLLVGNPTQEVFQALCCLDVTENIVEEAQRRDCQLVIAHHPIIFSGLKSLTGKNYVERTVLAAIRAGIGIYAMHTNLDNLLHRGVNEKIGQTLGIRDLRVLRPKRDGLSTLTALLKRTDKNWEEQLISYNITHFKILAEGQESIQIRFDFPSFFQSSIKSFWLLQKETMDFIISPSLRHHENLGAGAIGVLENSMPTTAFFERVKRQLKVPFIKHTEIHKPEVSKVAFCGGAGSFLLADALAQGADVFLTADYKYHEFFDAENKITIVDPGHYETEQFTVDLLVDLLTKGGLEALSTTVNTNPVRHF
jgi:dinuclear metal center YbgI/SA1388 family protein